VVTTASIHEAINDGDTADFHNNNKITPLQAATSMFAAAFAAAKATAKSQITDFYIKQNSGFPRRPCTIIQLLNHFGICACGASIHRKS